MTISRERPIFVIGVPRSGTTLLRFMLCSHPRIYIPPESALIARFFHRRPHAPLQQHQAIHILRLILRNQSFFQDWQGERPDPIPFVQNLPDLTPATFLDALFGQYARQFGAERWGEKTPVYADYIDLITEMFPTAQIIHIIRDGRDVALSMQTLKAAGTTTFFYADTYFAARTWRQRVRKVCAAGARLGADRYYEVYYEQLTANPEVLLREISDFLGEVYVAAMVAPHTFAREQNSASGRHAPTRQPVTTKNVGRWRHEMGKADQQLFQALAGDLLDELGYDTVDLGKLSLTEKARYARLGIKYMILETGRRSLRAAGVFHPTSLLLERSRA